MLVGTGGWKARGPKHKEKLSLLTGDSFPSERGPEAEAVKKEGPSSGVDQSGPPAAGDNALGPPSAVFLFRPL